MIYNSFSILQSLPFHTQRINQHPGMFILFHSIEEPDVIGSFLYQVFSFSLYICQYNVKTKIKILIIYEKSKEV
jgi:hypothetical protein